MKRHGPLLVLALVVIVLVGGLTVLFRLRLAQGDIFPEYSSLRADPLGTRALHDSLAQLAALRVERHYKTMAAHQPEPARTLLMAGLSEQRWAHVRREEFEALNQAVRNGSRLVIALRAGAARDERSEGDEEDSKPAERNKDKPSDKKEGKAESKRPKVEYADLHRNWGVKLKKREGKDALEDAGRVDGERSTALPEYVSWRSEIFLELEPTAEWAVIYRRDTRPVMIERRWGRGSIVLATDSYFLSNEALQRDRAPELLAWIVGSQAHVVFDEGHLGVMAEPGIAALARRYGLSGAFFTLLLLAALFVWRRTALFVPPVEEARDLALAYHPAAGLEALLRRAVSPSELAATCVNEWRSTARDSDRARVSAALAAAPKNAAPVALYNAAVRALRRR